MPECRGRHSLRKQCEQTWSCHTGPAVLTAPAGASPPTTQGRRYGNRTSRLGSCRSAEGGTPYGSNANRLGHVIPDRRFSPPGSHRPDPFWLSFTWKYYCFLFSCVSPGPAQSTDGLYAKTQSPVCVSPLLMCSYIRLKENYGTVFHKVYEFGLCHFVLVE